MNIEKILNEVYLKKENLPLNFQFLEVSKWDVEPTNVQGAIHSSFHSTKSMLITSFYIPLNIYLPKELNTK